MRLLHAKPKEEMVQISLAELCMPRALLLNGVSYDVNYVLPQTILQHFVKHVLPQTIMNLYQHQQLHRQLGMASVEETWQLTATMRWTKTARATTTSPWTSPWA